MLWTSGVHSPPPSFVVPSQLPRTTLEGGLPLRVQKLSLWLRVSDCGRNVFPICAGTQLEPILELFGRAV